MLIYRANSSSPAAPECTGYARSNDFDRLACGILMRNGDPYSPTIMNSLGLTPAFQYGIWNRRANYDCFGVCGEFHLDSNGPSDWHGSNDIVSMIAVIPSTITQNFSADLVFDDALRDQSGYSSRYKYMYAQEFLSHGWVTISHEYGSGYTPTDIYTENDLKKLSCIVLDINGLGATDYYDIYVSYRLAFTISDPTFVPTNQNFDMSILGLFNTLGTNEAYWTIQQPSDSYNDNQIITRNLSNLSIKYKVIQNSYAEYIVSGYVRFMYIYGWNDLRIFSPVIHFGPYSSLPNAAPSKNITVSGLAMMIEGYPHMTQ